MLPAVEPDEPMDAADPTDDSIAESRSYSQAVRQETLRSLIIFTIDPIVTAGFR